MCFFYLLLFFALFTVNDVYYSVSNTMVMMFMILADDENVDATNDAMIMMTNMIMIMSTMMKRWGRCER